MWEIVHEEFISLKFVVGSDQGFFAREIMFLNLESKTVFNVQLSFSFFPLRNSVYLPHHYPHGVQAPAFHCNYVAAILFSKYLLLSLFCQWSLPTQFHIVPLCILAFRLTFMHRNFFSIPLFYIIFYSALRSPSFELSKINVHQETWYYTSTICSKAKAYLLGSQGNFLLLVLGIFLKYKLFKKTPIRYSLYHSKSTYKYFTVWPKSTNCIVPAKATQADTHDVAQQGRAVPRTLTARQGTNTQGLSKLIMVQVLVNCPSWECQ